MIQVIMFKTNQQRKKTMKHKETIKEFLLKGEKEESFLISDIAKNGCSGGTISSLIYYDDTVKFHDKYEDEIWEELKTQAEDQGVTIPFLISDFSYSYIKMISDIKTFKNCLSWWVCEVIAQRIQSEREDNILLERLNEERV